MNRETKISKLKEAILDGEVLSPLDAWGRWRIAQNTFNRQIWELKKKHGLKIKSEKVIGIGKRVKFCVHQLDAGRTVEND